MKSISLVTLACFIGVLVCGVNAVAADAPDRIYINGHVIPMTGPRDTAEAFAVREGKFVAVGTTAKIRSLAGDLTVVVDLAGKTVLPGFYSAHDHLPQIGRTDLFNVDLNSPPIGAIDNIPELIAALRKKKETVPEGKLVFGRGYDDTLLAEKRHPTREDLDQVSTVHPIWIVHTSGHLGVANSLALKMLKIDRDTPQPKAGVIRKYPRTDEPNGVLEEQAASGGRLASPLTPAQRIDAIAYCDRMYLSRGVTTTLLAGGIQGNADDLVDAYRAGRLHLRIIGLLGFSSAGPMSLEKMSSLSPVSDHVRAVGLKLGQDGSLQGYTGFLTEPYYKQPEGKTDDRGYSIRTREQLTNVVTQWHRAGHQIAIHGNGDAAIDDILYAFRIAQQSFPRPDARHRIEHCQTPREDQLDLIKELGISPSFFVAHVYYWGDRHRDIFLGPERARRISPLKSAVDRGIRFTVHNDTPVTPVDPLMLVWTSVTRLTKDGSVLGPEQRINVYDALKSITADAAWQNFEEKTKGTIEADKLADFVVLDRSPLTVDPGDLKDIHITATVVGGEVRHGELKTRVASSNGATAVD